MEPIGPLVGERRRGQPPPTTLGMGSWLLVPLLRHAGSCFWQRQPDTCFERGGSRTEPPRCYIGRPFYVSHKEASRDWKLS